MKRIAFLLALILAITNSFAQQTIKLTNWKFKTGDNLEWANPAFDDAAWKAINVGEPWESQGYKDYDGFGWYRTYFMLPKDVKQSEFSDSLRIFLGAIDDYDQVFLNGKPIGQNARNVSDNTLPVDMTTLTESKWSTPRVYTLAVNDTRLQLGKTNVIAVRVFDSGVGGGMQSGPFQVRAKGLEDYLVFNLNPKPSVTSTDGIITKTISLKNTSSLPVINGLLKMEVVDDETKKVVSFKTIQTELKNVAIEYSLSFKSDISKRFVAHFTFTEAKTKSSETRRFEFPYILTPKVSNLPKINGSKVVGVRPGSPFLFRIPVTGIKPIIYSVENLPAGLILNEETGVISGSVSKAGDYTVKMKVSNSKGNASKELRIVVGDRIALTPPMGWNSWNCFGLTIDQEKAKTSADLFISTGLADHGWTYINLDDGWEAAERASDGRILSNEKFPNMNGLTDYIHSKGLKTGLYSSPGPRTCGQFLGSYQYEESDANTYAEWGFDYLKYDWCSYGGMTKDNSLYEMQKPYKVMQEALKKQNRDILYSLCQYGMGEVWKWGDSVGGQAWRTTGDILDNWEFMSRIGFNQEAGAPYAKPGNWNDPDMLVVGWVGLEGGMHYTHLTPNEQYTHISLWSLLAAPLLIGCDLTKLDDFTLNLLTNDEVIAIDQDTLGKQGTAVMKNANYQIIVKELEDGSKAVGLFNLTENDLKIAVPWATLGLKGKQSVHDVWRQSDIGVFNDKYESIVPPHGVVLVKISEL